MKVGFLGLGVMGGPMAGHLARAGHETVVWNRSEGRATPEGCHRVASFAELASCEAVFLCLGGSKDVEEVVGALSSLIPAGTPMVDHSTISPAAAAEIQSRWPAFVDAPITGGSMGAQSGTLTIFCGGDEEVIEAVKPAMMSYAKRVERVGGPGMGQHCKMANQIAVAGALLGLCESLAYAKNAGLDLAQTRDLLACGAAGSWAFDYYGPKILNEDWTPGFSIKNQLKDLDYALEEGEKMGMSLPTTEVTARELRVMLEAGQGELTTCALYEKMRKQTS